MVKKLSLPKTLTPTWPFFLSFYHSVSVTASPSTLMPSHTQPVFLFVPSSLSQSVSLLFSRHVPVTSINLKLSLVPTWRLVTPLYSLLLLYKVISQIERTELASLPEPHTSLLFLRPLSHPPPLCLAPHPAILTLKACEWRKDSAL